MTAVLRLLYAEDNPQDADLTRTYFEREAPYFNLEIVDTGAACLARLAANTYDVLLLDNHLPDMDGLEVLNKLRNTGHRLPVVLVTGVGDEETVVSALRAGADDYVPKTEDYLSRLPAQLRALTGRRLQDEASGEARTRRILYVEPNVMDAELTSTHLASAAPYIDLTVVASCLDALALLGPTHRFELVLTDLRVPGMDALSFIHEARRRGVVLPVIVITGGGDEATAVAILKFGSCDYLVKRDNYLMQLPHAIDSALHRFHLDQTTRRLNAELAALNASLEQRVVDRTAEIRRLLEAQQLAQGALTDSEARLAAIINTSMDAIITVDEDERVVLFNMAAEAIFQISAAHALGQHLTRFIPQHQRDPVAEFKNAEGIIRSMGHCVLMDGLRADGEAFPIEASISQVAVDGKHLYTLMVRDVTRQRRAQAQLQLLETCVARLNDIVIITEAWLPGDAGPRIVFVNEAFVRRTGYQRADVLGHTPVMLQGPRTDRAVLHLINDSIRQHRPIRTELMHYTQSGEPFWVELDLVPVTASSGVPTHWVAVERDMTERKRIEQAIQDNGRHTQAILDNVADAVITIGTDGGIRSFNLSATRMFGYAAEEAIGRNIATLMPEPYRSQHDAFLRTYDRTGVPNIIGSSRDLEGLRKDGTVFPLQLSVTKIEHHGAPLFVGLVSDISSRKLAEQEIERLAYYDALTGLPNRRLLIDRLQQALSDSARTGSHGALLLIDLDNFKDLNDSLGHDVGDLLLQKVAERLSVCVRDGDTVARQGGDEFVIMLKDLGQNMQEAATHAQVVSKKILSLLNQNYWLGGHERHCSPSIGITLFSDRQETVEALLKRADVAMYQAKAAGRNTLQFFDLELQAAVDARAALDADLRLGLQDEQFYLYYQPQVDTNGCVTGAEALLRWQHPQRGMVPPGDFIARAEQTGFILPLGNWVLEAACAQLVQWASQPHTAHLTLAVNVSAHQVRQADFVDRVLAALACTGANPCLLKLELTESMLVKNVEEVIEKMAALRERGVRFAMDDFGTGYSSLAFLKRLPLYQLKIDQSFVFEVLTDANDASIARTIITLGQSLGLAVIAEGVETEGQRQFLIDNGCQAFQGYLFSRPLPIAQFDLFVQPQGT